MNRLIHPTEWLLLLLAAACTSAGAQQSIILNTKKQLFLDDYLIDSATNVARVIHPVHKYSGNPVLADATVYGTVMLDEGKYRMWYQGNRGVRYAESQDGIHWSTPLFDVVMAGSQRTDLLIPSHAKAAEGLVSKVEFPFFVELFGVEKDPREKDATRRYKMGFLNVDRDYHGPHEDPFHKGSRRGFGVATSPDGIHWKTFDNWATEAICDGGSHFMYDERNQRYLLYGRTKLISPEIVRAWGLQGLPEIPMSPIWHEFVKKTVWGRAVARVESPDFLHWNIKEPAKAPVVMAADIQDQPGAEIYALMVFPYESVYIGLVKVWHRTPDGGPLDIDLAVSHDGVNFTRVGDRSAFIPVGGVGEWDRFNNSVSNNSPILVGDELRFYYSGRMVRHTPYDGKDTGWLGNAVGFGTIKRDRFVSLAASFDGGQIVTKPVRLAGKTLHLNAKSDFGEISLEVLDTSGKTLVVSKPIHRNGLDITVDWDRGGLTNIREPVVLRITLKNAHLYALWCS